MLPEYRNSLHIRYPPVCGECQPAVDEEIRAKDQMARTKALGGWLKQSKGKEKERKVSSSSKQWDNLAIEIAAWRLRGGLWYTTLALVLAGHATGEVESLLNRLQRLMLVRCPWVHAAFSSIPQPPCIAGLRAVVCNVDVLGSDLCGVSQS